MVQSSLLLLNSLGVCMCIHMYMNMDYMDFTYKYTLINFFFCQVCICYYCTCAHLQIQSYIIPKTKCTILKMH
jgi:hypothetical protein